MALYEYGKKLEDIEKENKFEFKENINEKLDDITEDIYTIWDVFVNK